MVHLPGGNQFVGAFRNYDPPTAALFLPLVVRDTRRVAGTSGPLASPTPRRLGRAGAPTLPAVMELPSDDANRLKTVVVEIFRIGKQSEKAYKTGIRARSSGG